VIEIVVAGYLHQWAGSYSFHPFSTLSRELLPLKQRPAGRNNGPTMSLTPVSYGWKNPDRSQKDKTFTSNRA
jgi:hypothetical protein